MAEKKAETGQVLNIIALELSNVGKGLYLEGTQQFQEELDSMRLYFSHKISEKAHFFDVEVGEIDPETGYYLAFEAVLVGGVLIAKD